LRKKKLEIQGNLSKVNVFEGQIIKPISILEIARNKNLKKTPNYSPCLCWKKNRWKLERKQLEIWLRHWEFRKPFKNRRLLLYLASKSPEIFVELMLIYRRRPNKPTWKSLIRKGINWTMKKKSSVGVWEASDKYSRRSNKIRQSPIICIFYDKYLEISIFLLFFKERPWKYVVDLPFLLLDQQWILLLERGISFSLI